MFRTITRTLTASILLAVPLASVLLSVPSATAASPTVVVSQIYGGGGNTGATLRHDFIELFNRGERTVDVSGWSVQYTSATGRTWQVTELTGSIEPGQYYLVKEAGGGGGTEGLPQPDARGTIALSATSGKVALVAGSERLTCGGSCRGAAGVLDFVGYGGAADEYEGSGPTATPSNTEAARRLVGGCADSDDNALDFALRAPRARNTAAPLAPCEARADLSLSMTASRATVETGTRFRYTITLRNAGPSRATNARITSTLADALVLEATDPAQLCSRTGRTVTCPLGEIAAGAERTVVLYVTAVSSGQITSTAVGVASEPDATPASASSALSAVGPDCEIVGTAGADLISGTDGSDVICALSGDDRISGGHGDDVVLAGNGHDRAHTGSGDDDIFGSSGGDALNGGGGADLLAGGDEADTLEARDGTQGNDTVNGGAGSDTCEADPGDSLSSCP